MNDFSPRLRQIALSLLEQNNAVSVKFIADMVGVSKRTVQRELEYLPSSLKKYNLSFHSKAGTGIWIDGDENDKIKLSSILSEDNSLDVSNRDERRKRLILELLKEKEAQKLFYYADILGVSEATVGCDIDAIIPWFKHFNIYIIRKQGYGVYLEGSEKAYRNAMSSFIDENISTEGLIPENKYDTKNNALMEILSKNNNNNNIYSLLDINIIKRVIHCLINLNSSHIAVLTDTSYIGLILHITIAIDRIMKNEIIEPDERLKEKLETDKDYILAMAIVSSLEKEFSIKIPDIETTYICLHIKGSKLQSTDSISTYDMINLSSKHSDIPTNRENTLTMIYEMIEVFDKEYAYLLEQDDDFINGLLSHMQPTLIRLSNGFSIKNPLLFEIKKNYPHIFDKCKRVSKYLENRIGISVPDEETGFLAVHFGAAVVRLEQNTASKRKVFIGIICASGIGISRFMKSKLETIFKNRACIRTYGQSDLLKKNVVSENDFFVSSINISDPDITEKNDILFASPLITDVEISEIETRINKYETIPQKIKNELEFTDYLDILHRISYQIKRLITDFKISAISPDIDFDGYFNYLKEIISCSEDKFSIIKKDITNREKLSSQVFTDIELALFHTRTKGVDKIIFNVLIPDNSSVFVNNYFSGIKCIMTMLIPMDDFTDENYKILGCISEALVENQEFKNSLISGDSKLAEKHLSFIFKKFISNII